jgi:hypothetical protein
MRERSTTWGTTTGSIPWDRALSSLRMCDPGRDSSSSASMTTSWEPATLARIDMQHDQRPEHGGNRAPQRDLDVLQAIRTEPPLDLLEEDPDIGIQSARRAIGPLDLQHVAAGPWRPARAAGNGLRRIDFETVIEATAPRVQSPAHNIVPSGCRSTQMTSHRYPYDPEEARALLTLRDTEMGSPSSSWRSATRTRWTR